MSTFTIPKNTVIFLLLASSVIMAAYIYYENEQHKDVRQISLENFDPGFDLMDPDHPLTKSDQLVHLRNKSKKLNEEKEFSEQLLHKIKNTKSEIKAHPFPSTIIIDSNNLSDDGIDFLNFYYRLPLFYENYFEGKDSISKYLINESINYQNLVMNKLLFSNIKPPGKFSSTYDFLILGEVKPNVLKSLPDEASSIINSLEVNTTNRLKTIKEEQTAIINTFNTKVKEFRDSRFDMSGKAIKWGIIAFVITAIVLYIAGLQSRERQRLRLDAQKAHPFQYEDLRTSAWYSVYLITVLLLIITIFVLGLARLLTENTLAALLGGIAGYVLNNKQVDTPTTRNSFNAPVEGPLINNDSK